MLGMSVGVSSVAVLQGSLKLTVMTRSLLAVYAVSSRVLVTVKVGLVPWREASLDEMVSVLPDSVSQVWDETERVSVMIPSHSPRS